MACKLNAGFCKVGLVLVVVCFTLMFTGCFTLLGLLLSGDENKPVENKPTEQPDDDIYVLEGSDKHQIIVKIVAEGIGNSPSFVIEQSEYLDSLEMSETPSVSYDVKFQLDSYAGLYKYGHSNLNTNVSKYLQLWTFDVEDGSVQSEFGNSIYSDEIHQYVKEVFDTVRAEHELHRGAITCVFRKNCTSGDFLARGEITSRYNFPDSGLEEWHDIYSYTVSGLEYLPEFTTITETGPDVEVVSKYKTFMIHPEIFKDYNIGPDGWKDTFDEGYWYGLSSYAETGYDEYGLYDIIDGWEKIKPYSLNKEYAMSLKLKSKGDGFYITEGGWKVYSTNRQNAKSLDDAWNSYSKTVNSYGLCYSIGLVPAGENKYELVLYAMTRT